jgi:hypothetical protein
MYSSTLRLTSAPDGGGQLHVPAALPPGNTQYPLYRRLGGTQGRSGRARKILPPPGFFFSNMYFIQYLHSILHFVYIL